MKNHRHGVLRAYPRLLAVIIAQLAASNVYAQGVASEQALETVIVASVRAPLDPNLPTTTASKTVEQARQQNFVNVEDALKYVPDMTIRKRYAGDRNSLIGGRSFSELQAPRGLVYADGYLLSQFLGQFNAPRWNVVAPEELARIDVLYGPFSAIYPGNSIGTTVVMTTRKPQKFEGSARVQYFSQHLDDSGFSGTYNGHQESAWLGNKVGDWSYTIGVNRLQNKSQPMQYVTLKSSGSALAATPVTGAVAALDPSGNPVYYAGPNGSSLEDDTQEQFKIKLGYDFSPALYGEVLYAYWHNNAKRTGASLLRDAAGNPVYAGLGAASLVSINGTRYSLPANSFSPQNVEESHGMWGFKLASKNKKGWNGSAVATIYDIMTDLTRTAPPAAAAADKGSYADNSGTGWTTLDLQSSYTPQDGAAHALALGYHINRYTLQNKTFGSTEWRNGGPGAAQSGFFGKTSLQALFAQDTWKLSQQWRLTTGMRYEEWKAFDGRRENAAGNPSPYPERTSAAWSPKASMSYQAGENWLLKASVGKGVRFPTVSELFQSSSQGTIVNSNPNLKPERSYAKEVAAERDYYFDASNATIRMSLFEDDVKDTILNQTNITVFPNVTNIQNVDRVRTRGIEMAASASDFALRGLDLSGSVTLSRSKILENANNPGLVGNNWVRVPRIRANLIGSYRTGQGWSGSLGARYSGRMYSTVENSDINPDTYGGVSSYTVLDAKVKYQLAKNLDASLGIDNLTDKKYYVSHPYPGRSIVGELHASF
jgi:iron complex outermembrane receptor protein